MQGEYVPDLRRWFHTLQPWLQWLFEEQHLLGRTLDRRGDKYMAWQLQLRLEGVLRKRVELGWKTSWLKDRKGGAKYLYSGQPTLEKIKDHCSSFLLVRVFILVYYVLTRRRMGSRILYILASHFVIHLLPSSLLSSSGMKHFHRASTCLNARSIHKSHLCHAF